MKKVFLILAIALTSLTVCAQNNGPRKFSPQQFKADLERFITKEACLTPQEAALFFPLFNEMSKKQRTVFTSMRRIGRYKPADERGCLEAINKRDNLDLELKMIQKEYHDKFLQILPASKVYDIIKAEDKFHRWALMRMNQKD